MRYGLNRNYARFTVSRHLASAARVYQSVSLLGGAHRELYSRYRTQPDPRISGQLRNLRYRIGIIRQMQTFGVASFFGCVLAMFVLFAGYMDIGKWIFGVSL